MFIARRRRRRSTAGCRAGATSYAAAHVGAPSARRGARRERRCRSLTVLDEARRGEQRVRVAPRAGSRVKSSTNVDGLVWSKTFGRLHEHAELARRAGLAVEHVEVLDDLRLLVDPLDRVGLQHELALDEDAAGEDEQARDRERRRDPVGQRPEPDDEPAERALAEVAALGRRLVLADAEDRERADDAVEADRRDAD